MRIILLIEHLTGLRAVDQQTISKMGTVRWGARDLGEDANSMALARALQCLLLSEMTWHAGFSDWVVAVIILGRLEQILALLLLCNFNIGSVWM